MLNTDFPTLIEKKTKTCCTCFTYINRPAYPYDFGVLYTFFAPIVRLYAQQRLLYDII